MLRDVRSMGTTEMVSGDFFYVRGGFPRGLAAGYPAGTDECVRRYMSSLGLGV
jgi:hypothetical protein